MLTPSQIELLERGEQEIDEILAESAEVAPFRYRVSSNSMSIDTAGLVSRIERGDIVIPEFQRGYVWSKAEASRFVESLLLGLPVPSLFMAVEPDTNRWLVIDGQQRLRTLQYFSQGTWPDSGTPFQLTGVQPEFSGKSVTALGEADRRQLHNSMLHVIVVRQEEPSEDSSSIYHVFERLNTSGVKLTPHEIRSAIHRGPLRDLVAELNRMEAWRSIYGPVNRFMRDQELILRFLALYHDEDGYRRPMKDFLNRFMARHKRLNRIPAAAMRAPFESAILLAHEALGRKAFRFSRAFNSVLFDSVMVGLARRLARGPVPSAASVRDTHERLARSAQFQALAMRATADEESVRDRLRAATEAFSSIG